MAKVASRYQAVQNLYETYHEVGVNRKYYSYRLEMLKQWNTVVEVLIAIGVSSSSVGAAVLLAGQPGKIAWGILGGVVSILAIVKPFLQLPKQIERYSRLFVGNNAATFELKKLVDELQERRALTPEVEVKYAAALERLREIEVDEDPIQNKRLITRFEAEVNADASKKKLWSPRKTGE
jgi:hypothetical protein